RPRLSGSSGPTDPWSSEVEHPNLAQLPYPCHAPCSAFKLCYRLYTPKPRSRLGLYEQRRHMHEEPLGSQVVERAKTWVELVEGHARRLGGKTAFHFLEDGENPTFSLSYADLARLASGFAGRLLQDAEAGDRVLLVFAPGLDFLIAFHAC